MMNVCHAASFDRGCLHGIDPERGGTLMEVGWRKTPDNEANIQLRERSRVRNEIIERVVE